MAQPALISIITPVYNAERFLDETVRSVLAQTYREWELLLIIDAKSRDRSLVLAQEWAAKDPRIQVIALPTNLGVANNRNNGIRIASGEYTAFLDADDLWVPEKLSEQIMFMQRENCEFSCHSYQQMTEQGQLIPVVRRCPPSIHYNDLLKTNVIGCLTVMIKSSLLKKHSFKEQIPHEDFILWLELLKTLPEARGLNKTLAHYRVLPSSRSGDKKRAARERWYLYREVIGLNWWASVYYFSIYALSAIAIRLRGR